MTVAADETTVRQFIEIISTHAVELAKGNGHPGVLQISTLSVVDEKLVPQRFKLDDVDGMVSLAVTAATAGLNVYIEARTVKASVRGNGRGKIEDTEFVFASVIDSDADKNKGCAVVVQPSLTVGTSRENHHYWYLYDRAAAGDEAKRVGDVVRAGSKTDGDTGVVTQCYRVAGTPNYPSKAKQARGRLDVEPTSLIEQADRRWRPEELAAAYANGAATAASPSAGASAASTESTTPTGPDEASLPDELMADIRDGGVARGNGAKGDKSRSGLFHYVIGELKKRGWSVEQIQDLLERHPNGVAAKYPRRLAAEIARSYDKVENGTGAGAGNGADVGPTGAAGAPPAVSSIGAGPARGPRRRSWGFWRRAAAAHARGDFRTRSRTRAEYGSSDRIPAAYHPGCRWAIAAHDRCGRKGGRRLGHRRVRARRCAGLSGRRSRVGRSSARSQPTHGGGEIADIHRRLVPRAGGGDGDLPALQRAPENVGGYRSAALAGAHAARP
jgi:hypothetical protein